MVRCAERRIPVWTHRVQDRFTCWLRVGTLLEPDRIAPDVQIFVESKQPWIVIPDGVPSFDKSYDWENNTFWPKASKKRDKALMAKIEK